MNSMDPTKHDALADDVEFYDRTQLDLPAALFRALLVRIPPGADRRLLQVCAGTGRLTLPLVVATGCTTTAIERNRHRVALAAKRLATQPNVEVVEDDFRTWPPPEHRFDVLLAFTGDLSDPVVPIDKAADVLRPGGLLVIIYARQIAGGDDRFLADAHECRRKFDPGLEPSFHLPTADQIDRPADPASSGLFRQPQTRRRRWDVTYPAHQYADVELAHYSHTRSMPEPTRTRYLDEITTLVRKRNGGRVTLRYLFELRAAIRRTAPARIPREQ
jgi:SAM-dependent methyltransferase